MSYVAKKEDWSVSRKLFMLALVITTAWKIYCGTKLDICFDEAYYNYWASYPRLSYFDHPPLVAWAMWLSEAVLGHNQWSVRIWPLIGSLVFTLIGVYLASTMFNRRAGYLAGTILVLGPLFVMNGLIMTPDTLFTVCWAGATTATWLALSSVKKNSSLWWTVAGFSTGIGFLSKYNMVLFFLSLGMLWLAVPEWRKRIFWGTFAIGLLALLLFSPVIIWNAQHDWASFRFQLNHGFASDRHSIAERLGNYIGGLLLIISPILGLFCFSQASLGLLSKDKRLVFLSSFFWPVVLFFGYSALKTWVQANWPMIAFFSATLLLAGQWENINKKLRTFALGLLIVGDLITMTYFVLPRDFPISIAGKQLDPKRMREFYGSQEAAQAVKETLAATNAAAVMTKSHQLFGSLSFYAPEMANKLLLPWDNKPRFPWIKREIYKGSTILLANFAPWLPEEMPRFGEVQFVKQIDIPFKGKMTKSIYLYLGTDYQP